MKDKSCWKYSCVNVSSKAQCKLSCKRMDECHSRESERIVYGGMVGGRRIDRADVFDFLFEARKRKEKDAREKIELKELRKIVKGIKK